jgi:hypothetical protein
VAALLLCVLALLLFPERAWAWGPATHIYLGEGVLSSLHLLPAGMRALLAAYPYDFLYGNVAADISLAKKYVPEGRHCHNWHVGEEIYQTAETERLQAVGLGYLAHLAADTVAHNVFVPRQLLLTSSSKALGHSYWEHRMDFQLGEQHMARAREVVMEHDHSAADALFDRVLSATLFSFNTNRRLFRGMIRFQDNDRWQSLFSRVLDNSRWTLTDEQVEGYVVRSFDYVVDYLRLRGAALAAQLDPVGDRNLGLSKKIRRMARKEGKWTRPVVLRDLADDFFPMPEIPFNYLRGGQVNGNGSGGVSAA